MNIGHNLLSDESAGMGKARGVATTIFSPSDIAKMNEADIPCGA